MKIEPRTFTLPNGEVLTVRSLCADDAEALSAFRNAIYSETHFMARYPEEGASLEAMRNWLAGFVESPVNFEVGAFAGEKLVGEFGVAQVRPHIKYRHRAVVGISELEKLLELTAVSIASDIVPITGENRILAYYGLKQLNSNPSLGLKGIIDICGLTGKEITISDIVFKIGPRINASGRMMNGKEAVDLLLAKDVESAREKSENINQYNDERRELDKKITDEANAIIDEFANMEDRKAIIVYNPGWHKGIIGIVASRLTEKYYRPAVVLTKSSELITGSARSVTGFDIYKAIENCRDLLENFGGHTYAAGLSLKEENLDEFTERFLKLAADEIIPEQMIPQIDIDAVLDLKDINTKFMSELKKMNPFGPDNQKPVFCSLNVKDYGTSKLVGKELEHIKLELIDDKSNTPIHGIAFGMHQHSPHINGMKPFNICYTIEDNTYNGNTTLQLMVKDIKVDNI